MTDAIGRANDDGFEGSVASRLRKRRAIQSNPDSRAAILLRSGVALPEPALDVGDGDRVVTLRVRALGGRWVLSADCEGCVFVLGTCFFIVLRS